MAPPDNKWRAMGKKVRVEGIAFAIPMIMLGFPLTGLLVGRWIGGQIGAGWPMFAGLALGIAMAVREVRKMLRMINNSTD